MSFYLDTTRVHPESYHWALKMAQEALDIDEAGITDPDVVFSQVSENVESIDNLDLEKYSEDIESNGFGNKLDTLRDISKELSKPFEDNRPPFQENSLVQIFNMFNYDSLEMLQRGRLVIAKIIGFKFAKPTEEDRSNINPLQNESNQLWMCGFCKVLRGQCFWCEIGIVHNL